MNLTLEKLQFIDFEENTQSFILLALESKTIDNYNRTFIAFNEILDADLIKLIPVLTKLSAEIHSAIGNERKISAILKLKNIKITAFTQKHSNEVILFSQNSSCSYAKEVFNTSSMQNVLFKFIRDKFYSKDKIIEYSQVGDVTSIVKTLKQNKFSVSDLQQLCNDNSQFEEFLHINNISELLNNSVTRKKPYLKLVKFNVAL